MKYTILILAVLFYACNESRPAESKDMASPKTNEVSIADTTTGTDGDYGELKQYFWKERSDTSAIKMIYFDSASKKSFDEDAFLVDRYLPIKKSKDGKVSIEQYLVDKSFNRITSAAKPGQLFMGAQKVN